jgi:hypothetical protein
MLRKESEPEIETGLKGVRIGSSSGPSLHSRAPWVDSDLISPATVNGKDTPKPLYYTGEAYQGAESAGSVS